MTKITLCEKCGSELLNGKRMCQDCYDSEAYKQWVRHGTFMDEDDDDDEDE